MAVAGREVVVQLPVLLDMPVAEFVDAGDEDFLAFFVEFEPRIWLTEEDF